MIETPYGQPKPPKTITKIKSDRFLDLTNLHTWIMFLAIGLWMYFFRQIANSITLALDYSRIPGYEELLTSAYMDIVMYASLLVLVLFIWLKYFRNDELVEFQKDRLIFFIGDLTGKHVINSFSEQMKTLMKLIPIIAIHENGMLEFDAGQHGFITKIKILLKLEQKKYNEFGVLFETFPPRISDEYRDLHELRREKIVNGLPVNTLFESISCSVEEPKKQILEYLLSLQKTSGGKARDQHLADMYLSVSEDDDPIISWRYFAFLSLGEHKTAEQAGIQFGAVVPGLLLNMKNAELWPIILQDERDVINAYQVMLGEMNL